MKKIAAFLFALLIISGITISGVYAEATAALTGPTVVRAGDTIMLSLKLTASTDEAVVVVGKFEYDSSLVSLEEITDKRSGWSTTLNDDIFYSENAMQNNPIGRNTTLFTVKFKVKQTVSTGKKIKISATDIDISNEKNFCSASYSINVAKPLSNDATLKSIKVEDGTLSPEFSSEVLEYDIGEVPFSVNELSVTATPNDSNADVDISGKSLSVGKNTVKITVTAETGDKKEYTLTVTRQQDPNYVPSSNANLSEITLSTGVISPHISDEMSKYIVYVPFETQTISISGVAQDSKATGVTSVTDGELTVGENIFELVCTAEDGTEKIYTVTVMRMEEYTGVSSEFVPESSEMPSETPSEGLDSSTDTSSTVSEDVPVINYQDGEEGQITDWLLYLVLIVGSLLLGITLGAIAIPKRRGNRYK